METESHGRAAILAWGIGTMLMFGTIYSWSVFIPPLEAEFGWVRSQTSFVFSLAMVSLSFGMLAVGFAVKRFSLRACFVCSTLMIVAGLGLCRFVTELWQLYLCYGILCGFGSGVSYAVWTTNVLAWYGDRVGFASGMLVMGFGMGALVLGSLASWLIYSPIGWRWAFFAIGALVLAEGMAALRFIRTPPPSIAARRPAHDDTGVSLPGSIAVRQPSFWLFCLWRSLVMGACGALFAESLVMMTGIGASRAFATAAVGALGLGNGLGRPLGGLLHDRIGQNRTLVALSALAIAVSLGMAGAYWFASPALFAPFLLIDGLLYGMFAALNTAFMRTTFGQEHLAANTGASAVVLAPFNLAFPLVAAFIFERLGSYEPFFALIPALAAVSLVCALLCAPANRSLARRFGGVGQAAAGGAAEGEGGEAEGGEGEAGRSSASLSAPAVGAVDRPSTPAAGPVDRPSTPAAQSGPVPAPVRATGASAPSTARLPKACGR